MQHQNPIKNPVTLGRGGVNTPTSSLNKVKKRTPTEKPDDETIPEGWTEEKFVFRKRGKLKKKEIVELQRTHYSLKSWIKTTSNTEVRTGGESVMSRVSRIEDPGYHGDGHTPLLGPSTITEKGVGMGQVVGLHITGDQRAAHTPVPGPQADQADLRKVTIVPWSPDGDVTATKLDEEEFSSDTRKLVETWNKMEEDESEWKVEKGLRRGGRRVSRRISELLTKFEGEICSEQVESPADVNPVQKNILISHTEGRGAIPKSKYNVAKDQLPRGDVSCSERCDWLTEESLSTNERPARRQVETEWGNNDKASLSRQRISENTGGSPF